MRPSIVRHPSLTVALSRLIAALALVLVALTSTLSPARAAPTWTQRAELTAADGALNDLFGASAAVDSDTALVGAPDKNNYIGGAYVFVRRGTTWIQQAELIPGDEVPNGLFGFSVALSGDTALIGAIYSNNGAGAVYVFVRRGTTWTQQAELVDPVPMANSDEFGISVALSGNTALIGAAGKNNGAGVAYVFVQKGSIWTQQAELTASDGAAGDSFGFAASLYGDTALIGAWGKNNLTGAAYTFVRSGTTWTQQSELLDTGAASNDGFGNSVALSGDMALIGAPFKTTSTCCYTGAAYVFVRNGATWTQQAELVDPAPVSEYDNFGVPVALSGDTALVAAPFKSVGECCYAGVAYVFARSGTTWTQQAAGIGTPQVGLGASVALSGDTALMGATGGNEGTGSVYVYGRS